MNARWWKLVLAVALAVGLAACGTGGGSTSPDAAAGDGPAGDGGGDAGAAADAPVSCPTPTGGPTEHGGVIAADETWTADGSPHVVVASVRIEAGATLTLAPCAEVRLAAGVRLQVGSSSQAGFLSARGTAGQPIRLERRDAQPWGLILVEAQGHADLAHVTIAGGGDDLITYDGASLVLYGDSTPPLDPLARVEQVTVRGSAGLGVLVGRGGGFASDSAGLTITGSGAGSTAHRHPLAAPPDALGTLPDGDYTGNGVDGILVAGSTALPADAVIRPLGVDYHVETDLAVGAAATVTLAAGVTLRMGAEREITVGEGSLHAAGTATSPVLIDALDPLSPWGNLRVVHPGAAILTHTTLAHGGSDEVTYDGASLVVWGPNAAPLVAGVKVADVAITGSQGYGALVGRLGGFTTDSVNLTVSACGSAAHPRPVRVQAHSAGTLPAGTYTGNLDDRVELDSYGGVGASLALADRGVPYYLPLSLSVAGDGGAAPTLTVAAGVELQFAAGTRLQVSSGGAGALQALGTATRPVVFTSASAARAAGDWTGLYFAGPPGSATNRIEHARVEYAGGDCSCTGYSCHSSYGSRAAILILGWRPSTAFVTDTTILASAGHGVNRGWTSDDSEPDFLPTNTFTDVQLCRQTLPTPQTSSCPTALVCPD